MKNPTREDPAVIPTVVCAGASGRKAQPNRFIIIPVSPVGPFIVQATALEAGGQRYTAEAFAGTLIWLNPELKVKN